MMIKPTFRKCLGLFLALFSVLFSQAQVNKQTAQTLVNPKSYSASEIKLGLEKLGVLGSVLYFAAHPDDENTRLLAWLANEKKYRTAYLSLTRGDGGQNLLGPELGVELGLIRTHEMMAARNQDGSEQFFSAAYDFGFSKTHTETFSFWNKEEILREAVYIIRKFKPHVIINRFPPDERGGHGHHQASAILAKEAFLAAADPNKFPEQVKELGTWQVKRMLWNTANFGGQNNINDQQLKVEIGDYNTLLGKSYGEIAAVSRSQHKSQGFGAASNRGLHSEYFEHVAGEKAEKDLMDGVNTSWSNWAGGEKIQNIIHLINDDFDYKKPHKSIPSLISLYHEVQKFPDTYWKEVKSKEIQDLILACAGIYVDALTEVPEFIVGKTINFQLELMVRQENVPVTLSSLNGQEINKKLEFNQLLREKSSIVYNQLTQPYWLRKPHSLGKFDVDEAFFGQPLNIDGPSAQANLKIYDHIIPIHFDLEYRYVNPVHGEVFEPIRVIEPISATTSSKKWVIRRTQESYIDVLFNKKGDTKLLTVEVESDFEVEPKQILLDFNGGNSFTQRFKVSLPANKNIESGTLKLKIGDTYLKDLRIIQYPHIPSISWQPEFEIELKALDVEIPVKRIAYLKGAGDLVGESLKNLGITVEEITLDQITSHNLKDYEALIVGVRAYNVNPALFEKHAELMDYVKQGGVVLVQYQVNGRFPLDKIGPHPFSVARARVTEENAKVHFLNPQDRVLNYPNRITESDFEGWIQERGLYFVENVDSSYRKPLGMHDVNEKMHEGSLIVSNHGEGKFVYTSLSFFRQIPAGVPGAYRLLMNLLAK